MISLSSRVQATTVQDQYVTTLACTPEHDVAYLNISIYQAKCHPPVPVAISQA